MHVGNSVENRSPTKFRSCIFSAYFFKSADIIISDEKEVPGQLFALNFSENSGQEIIY